MTSQYPPEGRGGLGTYVRGLCAELAHTHAVTVIGPTGGAPPPGGPDYVPVAGSPLDPRGAEEWVRAALEAAAADPPALLHAHNYEVALPGLAAAGLGGLPLVVTVHLPAPPVHRRLERLLLDRAVSRSAVSLVAAALQDPPCSVIPGGIDGLPGSGGQPRQDLLFAGRFAPQKGLDTALHALALLRRTFPALRLRAAGAGGWELAYRNLARSLGIGAAVDWLGWLDRDALSVEMSRCAVFLMPSRSEPFGLAALEALAAGAPVVASAVGGLPSFLLEPQTGALAPPDDPSALAAAVGRVLESLPPEAALRAWAARWRWDRAAATARSVYAGIRPGLVRDTPPAEAVRQAIEGLVDAG